MIKKTQILICQARGHARIYERGTLNFRVFLMFGKLDIRSTLHMINLKIY